MANKTQFEVDVSHRNTSSNKGDFVVACDYHLTCENPSMDIIPYLV